MSLTILTNEQISALLESLTINEAEEVLESLRSALHEYSTAQQPIDAGLIHQPERTVIHSKATGATTLFMPSANRSGHGVKVVTLSGPDADPSLPAIKPSGSVTLFSPEGPPTGFLHAKTLTAFRTALASTLLLTRRRSVKTLVVYGSGLQAYWHVRLALMFRGHTVRHVHIINRRFSENAKDILKKFHAVPLPIKEREGWTSAKFSLLTPGYGDYSRLQAEYLTHADVIFCCTPSTEDLFSAEILTNYEARRKGRLIVAVGSYKPNMREIPRELLLQATGGGSAKHLHYKHATEGGVIVVDTLDGALKEAGELIEAGLQPNQLVEVGELVMIHKLKEEELQASTPVSETPTSESLDKLDLDGGNNSSAMATALAAADLDGTHSPPQSSSSRSGSRHRGVKDKLFHRRTGSRPSSSSSEQLQQQQDGDREREKEREREERKDHHIRWIREGNVIYKSVGLGLMDLVVGHEVVRLAREKGVGSVVENFS